MLWSIMLPIQIISGILLAATILFTLLAPLIRCSRSSVFLTMTLISGAAFFPLYSFVYKEVGRYRYGIFQYTTAADTRDYHFDNCLPPTATKITTDQFEMGHRARFTIEEVDLQEWIDVSWSKFGTQSISPRSSEQTIVTKEELENEFEGLNWELPNKAVLYPFPVAPDGATVNVWYDHETKTAFTRAYYW